MAQMTKQEWDILQNSKKKKEYKYISTGEPGKVKMIEDTDESKTESVNNDEEKGYVKNNLFNRVFNKKNILENQILQENKALNNVAPLRKFHVDYANAKDAETLKQLNHNPEYISPEEGIKTEKIGNTIIPKGKMLVNDDPNNPTFVNVKHPGKYSTLINKGGLLNSQIKDLATNDFTSHALHKDVKYNDLSNQLKSSLLNKYPKEMIDRNGGVDAYVRCILSDDEEYKPYKDEMQGVVSPELINSIKSYIKTGKTNK